MSSGARPDAERVNDPYRRVHVATAAIVSPLARS